MEKLYTLKRPVAKQFVQDVLGLKDVGKKLRVDRLGVLQEIVEAFSRIPFQNVSLLSRAAEARMVPAWSEDLASVFSGKGGLSYTMNGVLAAVLKALGYDSHLVVGSVCVPGSNNHLITILRNVVKDGDTYLADVGFGYPTFHPVPLDFQTESPIYKESYITYKFSRVGDQIVRFHQSPVRAKGDDFRVINGWTWMYSFKPIPRGIQSVRRALKPLYTNPSTSGFLRSFRMERWINRRAICIKDNTLLIEGEDNKLHSVGLESDDEILQAVQQFFPEFNNLSDVRTALETCHKNADK